MKYEQSFILKALNTMKLLNTFIKTEWRKDCICLRNWAQKT
jgi:hypothetical protein